MRVCGGDEKSGLDKMSRQLSWFLGGTPSWGLGRGSCPLDSGPEREERVFNLRPAEVEVRTRNTGTSVATNPAQPLSGPR